MPLDGDQRAACAPIHPGGAVGLRRVAHDHGASVAGVRGRFNDEEWTRTVASRIEHA